MKAKNFFQKINTKSGFLTLLVICYWIKYLFVAYFDFNLGLSNPLQHIIMWTNPFGTSIILISLGCYFTKPVVSYVAMLLLDFANSALLFANVLYYRQFTDFITVKTMANISKVSQGLGKSSAALLQPSDILIWIDLVVIIFLLIFKVIKIDKKSYSFSNNFAITSFGVFMLMFNLMVSECNRPRLLKNTFDRTYVVKYLGIDTYTVYDALKNESTDTNSKNANAQELNKILQFVNSNYAKPNSNYFGIEKNKNVIIIHLESFQQFLINLKVNGKEVTPFLNSLYKDKHTLSYSNFFHQVGLGRTSDAENMLETSTYGISDGSLFTSLGSNNTFQAAPQILRQSGYTSAVFHGNVGSFWNRNDVYKNLGYNYFFDANYFSNGPQDSSGYGLKDKLLFSESVKYLEKMQQPFYTKFITVTNHTPFELSDDDSDPNFKSTNTIDATINNYFKTAHYLDQSVKEFFTYLKKSGLYDKSMIVIYGDHYGLSNDEYTTLAPIIGKNPNDWSSYNTAQMQRVPFMIHATNIKGGIQSQYAGEIDVLPTLLHLLGVNTKGYVQFGTDLLSSQHKQWIVFRNGTIITPKYTIIGAKGIQGSVYDTKTGKLIKQFTDQQKSEIAKIATYGKKSLIYSDTLNTKNLLRYYTPIGFVPDTPSQFNYSTNYQQMMKLINELGKNSTALYSQKGSTTKLYSTDAKELINRRSEIDKIPENILNNSSKSSSQNQNSSSSSSK